MTQSVFFELIHGGLEDAFVIGNFCLALGDSFLVRLVPMAVAFWRKGFHFPARGVPLDKSQPEFFVIPTDLGRILLDISLYVVIR